MKTPALAALLLVLAPPVFAAGALAFPAVDMNKDGFVDWNEAHRKMPRLAKVHFDKCDIGGDGLIDAQEYPLLQNFYWMNYVMDQ